MWRKLFNRRKHPRFVAAQNTYIIFGYNSENEKILPIVEISEGGCQFVYPGDESVPEQACYVALMSDQEICLERIKISTVSDMPAVGSYKKRGVAFKPESTLDIKRIVRLIRKASLCKT